MEKHPASIGSLLFLGVFVFGELVPKRVGMCAPEVISKLAAVPMKAFSCAAAPFVWVLSKSTVFACNLLGVRNTTDRVTEEEIRLMIQENARDGDIQDVECIFNLGDRNLESIITSRGGGYCMAGCQDDGTAVRSGSEVRLSVLDLIING